MAKKTGLKGRLKRRIIIPGLLLSAVVIVSVLLYMLNLSGQIDERFSDRPWDIPSRVYSDTTFLYDGQHINKNLLVSKLHRLGYRDVSQSPERRGEMHVTGEAIFVYLRDFHTPTYSQESRSVKLSISEGQIESIKNSATGESLTPLELEPEELMLYFGPRWERRQYLSIRTLPPYVVHAILAAEDGDFYEHQGISFKGIARAFIQNLKAGKINQGASTVTQQVARMFFLTKDVTIRRKIREQLIAIVLELKFSKEEILEIFLNETNWGQQGSAAIVGLAEAARFYFDKKASDLSVAEAAALAVVIRNSSYYSPYRNPDKLVKMRNLVLDSMKEEGWLDENTYETALASPLEPVQYTNHVRQARYFTDYLTGQISELYPMDTLTSEGFSIYTTIDTQVQQAAEEALRNGLRDLETKNPKLQRKDPGEKLQGAVIVMQPKTGYILAMAGGRNYGVSQFNRAANAYRQPGSAFKPFAFLTAMDRFSPVSKLSNFPQSYTVEGEPWTPKNYEMDAPEEVTMREALAYSQNIATVNLVFADDLDGKDAASVDLAMAAGLEKLKKTVHDFHFAPIENPYPSMVLGAQEITPLMLARAYCAFAADGRLPYPLSVSSIVDEKGKVIERRHSQKESVISPAKAYLMSDMLKSAVEIGTGKSLKNYGIDWPAAGKTGTTNEARDAWFVGYTPNILAVVWVGFDNNDRVYATGSRAALPIWARLMKSLPQYVSGKWFEKPSGIETVKICKESGLIARDGCKETEDAMFLTETAPEKKCDIHKSWLDLFR